MNTHRYRRVFANPAFRRLWFASVFARIAEAIAMVALPLFVYEITGSARMMSVIFMLQVLPRALLAPFAGVIADRFDRRRVMIGATSLRAAGAALLPFCREPWQVGVIAAVIGIGATLLGPAELATLPTLVPPEDLVPSLSAIQVTGAITRIAAPAAAAGIIALSGVKPVFWLQSVCLLISIFWLFRLQLPPREQQTGEAVTTSLFNDMADGFRTVWRTPIVRAVCATEGLWSLCFAVLGISAVIYLEETLDLGDKAAVTYGILMATMSLGAVLGALSASRVEQRVGRSQMIVIGYLGPLALLPVYVQPPLPVLFCCWFVFGFADALAVIAMQAYLVESVDDTMRGRVFAIWAGIISASAVIAFLLVGWFTDAAGPAAALAAAGLIAGLGGPLILLLTVPPDKNPGGGVQESGSSPGVSGYNQ